MSDNVRYIVKRPSKSARYVFKVMKELQRVQTFEKPFRPREGLFTSLHISNGDKPLAGRVVEVETYVDGVKTDQTAWVFFKSDGCRLGIRLQNFRNFVEKLHSIDLLGEE